jgi:hypothetical protein
MRAVLGLVTVAAAAATIWAGGPFDGRPRSRPDFVAAACSSDENARACSTALRYLAALDLDRADEACTLLAPSTLGAAGGMPGCAETLRGARGIRIHYSISAARPSLLGTTVRFSTWADGDAPIRQQMLVSPAGRIVIVAPEL